MRAGGSHSTNLGLRRNLRLEEMKGEVGWEVRVAGAAGVCGGGGAAAEDRRSPKKRANK